MTDRYHARQTLERTFDTDLAAMWAMWTTASGLAAWHGPRGFSTEVLALEPRAGGAFVFRMTARDPAMVDRMQGMGRATSWVTTATVRAFEPMTRFVYEHGMDMGGREVWMLHTLELTEVEGGVHLRLVIDATTDDMITPAMAGWRGSFDRLAEALA